MLRFVILLLISVNSFALSNDKLITLTADPWCPWNCLDPKNPGITVEIAKAIYEPLGYEVKYLPMDWLSGVEEAVKGKITGLIGINKTMLETRDFFFPNTAMSHADDIYILRADSEFFYTGVDSLKGKVIGIVDSYSFGDEIGKYVADHYNDPEIISQVSGIDGAAQNLKKLLEGKIDIYLDNRAVILWNANRLGITNQIKIGGELKENSDSYIAFSPVFKQSRMLAYLYDVGIAKLQANGEYQKIFDKYIPRE